MYETTTIPRRRVRFTNLASERRRLNLSQDALASAIGVHRMTIYRIEKARLRPSLDLAMTIAAALGVPVWQLFVVDEA